MIIKPFLNKMIKQIAGILLIMTVTFCISALASEEDYIDWKQVKIVSPEYKQTGTIIFEVETDGDVYKSVSITTFGKEYKFEAKDLSKLKGFPVSSISITHEVGYSSLGGHTVHFRMKRVYYKSEKLVEEKIRISISKGKGLEI